MIDLKEHLQNIIARYHIQDAMTKLQLEAELEEEFFNHLNTQLLTHLPEAKQRELLNNNSLTADEYFSQLYNQDDADTIIAQALTSFTDQLS